MPRKCRGPLPQSDLLCGSSTQQTTVHALTIPQDRTTTQKEYSYTQLRDARAADEKLLIVNFFAHTLSTYIGYANATLALVRHDRHQQRERYQHEC